jgi:hypothetical protein
MLIWWTWCLLYRCGDSQERAAVRELTDTIFEFSGVAGVPEGILNDFQERLVRSELMYRRRSKDSIPEKNVIRAVNNLAHKLNAPDYVTAYSSEVRLLREDSRSGLPHLISPEAKPKFW